MSSADLIAALRSSAHRILAVADSLEAEAAFIPTAGLRQFLEAEVAADARDRAAEQTITVTPVWPMHVSLCRKHGEVLVRGRCYWCDNPHLPVDHLLPERDDDPT